ncbi:MAG: hypothetical protein AABX39_00330 [Nanoarchaeota archaeon]
MTEQKLSLDEMIDLAKAFDKNGKWRFGKTRNPQFFEVLETEKLDEVYMKFSRDCNTSLRYSIYLSINGRDSEDEIIVENYFVDRGIVKNRRPSEEYLKISELYSIVKLGAYASQSERQRQIDAEASYRHILISQRKTDAIEIAKKLIEK